MAASRAVLVAFAGAGHLQFLGYSLSDCKISEQRVMGLVQARSPANGSIKPRPRLRLLQAVAQSIHLAGVVIATPAETHFQLAHEALLAGKHVLVEKPLVLDQ